MPNAFAPPSDPRSQIKPTVPGNLDPYNRPIYHHPDGRGYGTAQSLSFYDENPRSQTYGLEVLVPTIINGKAPLDLDGAKRQYYATGQHFGAFRVADPSNKRDPGFTAADAYAQWLHEDQARRIEADPTSQWKSLPSSEKQINAFRR